MGSHRVGHDWSDLAAAATAFKGCSVVNEEGVFLEFSCIFYDPTDVSTLISGYCAFFKSILNIWKSLVHVLLKPSLEKFEHCFVSMWNECNCVVVWTFFGTALLWNWNESWNLYNRDARNNKWAKHRHRTQVHTQKSITCLHFKNEQLNGIETCITSCKKRITSLGSLQDTGCLGLVHPDDPKRWYGEGGRRRVQDWELMYTHGRLILMYGKTNTVL